MDVFTDVADLRAWRASAAAAVALVPTMGALHDGHLALVAAARERCPTVLASIFVNPMQFGPKEDLASYPRDLPGDLDTLRAAGVAAVFAPSVEAFVPGYLVTTVSVAQVTAPLEGVWRPGHFDGVATIVTKLFNATAPHVAVFGEKDYQQLTMIRRMVTDLNMPIEIVGVPIVRADDGLALSSRNVHLSPAERARALTLSRALRRTAQAWDGDADAARALLAGILDEVDGVDVDYADVVDEHTLAALHGDGHASARALVAARVGSTRLIDNLRLALPRDTQRPGELRSSRNGPGMPRDTQRPREL